MITTETPSPARFRRVAWGVILVAAAWGAAGTASAQSIDTRPAEEFLAELLTRPGEASEALLALRATGDVELAPIFTAMMRSEDRSTRLFAAAALPSIAADGAVAPLMERLSQDSMMAVRAEAMGQLLDLGALGISDLTDLIQVDEDEAIRCLAARALVDQGQGQMAQAALKSLTESAEVMTASSASAALLKMGDASQLPPLRQVMEDPNTDPSLLWVLLLQIEDQQITQAEELVRNLAHSDRPVDIRLRAYQVIAALANDATAAIVDAMMEADGIVLRIGLLRLLADRPDGPARLDPFAQGSDPVALLARLEMARPGGGPRAQQAAQDVAEAGHPILLNYLLTRAQQDIEAHGPRADYYQNALLTIVRAVRPNAEDLGQEHLQAAQAAMLLGDLGSPEGLKELGAILTGPRTATCRAVAAGVNKSGNPAVGEIIAPLLDSPYNDLFVYAALTLGAHGDPRAEPYLQRIVDASHRFQPITAALASWYLIRNAGQTGPVAQRLAAGIR